MSEDERFSLEDIERASQEMYGPNIEQQQMAADYLLKWQHSTHAPEEAFDVLARSQNGLAKVMAAQVLYENFKVNYGQSCVEFRQEWRMALIAHLRANTGNPPLASKLTQILVIMALFDWPERWPDFPFDIYPDDVPIEGYGNTMVFDDLIAQTLSSPIIDSERRVFLMGAINQLTPKIVETAIHGLGDSAKVPTAVSILKHLTHLSPVEMLLKEPVLAFITASFQEFDSAHVQALELAMDLLLERHDAAQHFLLFGPRILIAKSEIAIPSIHLASFFLHFLCVYLESFEQITDEKLLLLLRNEMLQSFTWRLPSDSLLLWKFWFAVISRVHSGDEQLQRLMDGTWENVITSYIQYFIVESSRSNSKCQKTWNLLVQMMPQVIAEFFMRYETLDFVFCFAVGCTVKLLPHEMGMQIAAKFFDMAVGTLETLEKAPETVLYHRSLLFLVSTLLDVMEPSQEAIGVVYKNIQVSLESNNEFLIDGVLELLDCAQTLVQWNDWEFARFLASHLDMLLNGKKGYTLFKRLNALPIDNGADLAQPLVQRLTQWLQGPTARSEALFLVFKCLTKAKASVFPPVWPVLRDVALMMTGPSNFFGEHACWLGKVIAHGFSVSEFVQVRFHIQYFIERFSSNAVLEDELYQLIATARSQHPETESLWPNVLTMASARANNVRAVPSSFFDMISQFDSCPEVMNHSAIMSLINFAIQSLDHSLTASAITLLRSVIGRMTQEYEGSFALTYRGPVLSALFDILTDMLHSASTRDVGEVLVLLFKRYEHDTTLEADFVDALHMNVPGLEDEVALKLFVSLKSAETETIDSIICDFLVAAHRYTLDGIQKLAFHVPSALDEFQDGPMSDSDAEADTLIDQMKDLSVQHQ